MISTTIVQCVNDKQYFLKDEKKMRDMQKRIFHEFMDGLIKDYAEISYEGNYYRVELSVCDMPFAIQKQLLLAYDDYSHDVGLDEYSADDQANPILMDAVICEHEKNIDSCLAKACERHAESLMADRVDSCNLSVRYHADNGEPYYVRR